VHRAYVAQTEIHKQLIAQIAGSTAACFSAEKYGADLEVRKCVIVEGTSLLVRKATLRSDKGNCIDKYYYSTCCWKYVDAFFGCK